MNPAEHDTLLNDRLNQYRHRMKEMNALPFLCIGIGYFGPHRGRAVTMLDDKCQPDQAIEALEKILEMLKAKVYG